MLSWADWATIALESTGLVGSWYLSWATSSFKNASRSRIAAGFAGAGPGSVMAAGALVLMGMMVAVGMSQSCRRLEWV